MSTPSRTTRSNLTLVLTLAGAALAACVGEGEPSGVPDVGPSVATGAAETPSTPAPAPMSLPTRIGGALMRAPDGSALYVADEDHGALRRVALPVDVNDHVQVGFFDGARPAQVLPLADQLLVTLRDPSALVSLRDDPQEGLVEQRRVSLPDDAWGLALSDDGRTVLVTSAWAARVSAVDLASFEVRWSVAVEREPRGVVVTPAGVAYVSHLVGGALTRIDGIGGAAPDVSRVSLPVAPLRALWAHASSDHASLGYALALSPDGSRLFAARHAPEAARADSWAGASTVDVLLTAADEPLAPERSGPRIGTHPQDLQPFWELRDGAGFLPGGDAFAFVQPRAMVYRATTDSLLVASEGSDTLVELDARTIAPAFHVRTTYPIGQRYDEVLAADVEGGLRLPSAGGAPTGIALSADERTAYVWCRSTSDLAIVSLDSAEGPVPYVRLAEDPLDEEASVGRRLFYSSADFMVTSGMGCAGCHPEGRDDGFVWRELVNGVGDKPTFVGNPVLLQNTILKDAPLGVPRQTPMLAGRVDAPGPYGWHADGDLVDRIAAGFRLHRWAGLWAPNEYALRIRAKRIAAFLRKGLVPPPVADHSLGDVERRGRELFFAESTQCSECHLEKRAYGHAEAFPLSRLAARRGYEADPNTSFKVPSLRFVAGTSPYLHDGSAPTLEALLDANHDRMGRTSQLSREDKRALVAFLRTL